MEPCPGEREIHIERETRSVQDFPGFSSIERDSMSVQQDAGAEKSQSNQSDALFLKDLAAKAKDAAGKYPGGYSFFIQDDELHFHPRELDRPPQISLTWFTDRNGLLRSFSPSTHAQGSKGAGAGTTAAGVDPRKKEALEETADNAATERPALGSRTFRINAETGESEAVGEKVPSFDCSEGFHEEPQEEPAQEEAEAKYTDAEMEKGEAETDGVNTWNAVPPNGKSTDGFPRLFVRSHEGGAEKKPRR